jgi:hypothetical protein
MNYSEENKPVILFEKEVGIKPKKKIPVSVIIIMAIVLIAILIYIYCTNFIEKSGVVIYPEGKTKETVEIGDIVKIGTEEFYVIKHDGKNLVLLAHYNLKVGDIFDMANYTRIGEYKSDENGYGIQSEDTKGCASQEPICNGTVPFATTHVKYWLEKWDSYSPRECEVAGETVQCAYVYDQNSNIYQYVDNYKNYLKKQGAVIKEARLLSLEEAYELGCVKADCENAPKFLTETEYWLGTAWWLKPEKKETSVWAIAPISILVLYPQPPISDTNTGVRPVIVI